VPVGVITGHQDAPGGHPVLKRGHLGIGQLVVDLRAAVCQPDAEEPHLVEVRQQRGRQLLLGLPTVVAVQQRDLELGDIADVAHKEIPEDADPELVRVYIGV
jgi:hypothetical protein